MGFVFTLLFIVITHLSVDHVLPFLAPYRPMIWLSALGILVSLITVPSASRVLRAPAVFLFIGFYFFMPASRVLRGWFGGALPALLDFLPAVVLFFLVLVNVNTARRARVVLICLLLSSFYMVTRGMIELNNPTEESAFVMKQRLIVDRDSYEIQEVPRIRSVGFLADPNDFAQYLLMLTPVLLLLRSKNNPIANLFLVYLPFLFMIYGILLTRSRGGALGLFVILLFFLRDRVNALLNLIITSGAVLLGMGLQFGAGRAISVGGGSDRLEIWSDGLGMLKSSPLWGIGYSGFTEFSRLTAHNSYLLCAAEMGLIGFFLWMGMIVLSISQLHRLNRGIKAGVVPQDWAQLVPVLRYSTYGFLTTCYFLSRTYSFDLYILIALITIVSVKVFDADPAQAAQQAQPVQPEVLVPDAPQLSFTSSIPITFNQWFRLSMMATFGAIISIYIAVRMRSF